jgi:hypothetical protein
MNESKIDENLRKIDIVIKKQESNIEKMDYPIILRKVYLTMYELFKSEYVRKEDQKYQDCRTKINNMEKKIFTIGDNSDIMLEKFEKHFKQLMENSNKLDRDEQKINYVDSEVDDLKDKVKHIYKHLNLKYE